MDMVVLLFGLGVGVLVGTTGIGGGSIMTPLLILVLGTKPVVAIGTDLVYAAITKTVGGWRHLRKGTVSLSVSGWLAVGSVPGALGGVVLLRWLHHRWGEGFDEFVLWAVAGALLAGSIPGVWIGTAWSGRISQPAMRHALGIVLITASVGLMTKAGAPFPAATMIAVPLVLGGAALWNARRQKRQREARAVPAGVAA